MPTASPELHSAVDLVDGDGRLRTDAIGWSRRPLHRCALRGHALRKKRWDYWCVTTRDHLLAVTLADIDYLGLVVVTFLDYATRTPIERVGVVPGGFRSQFPDLPHAGDLHLAALGVRVAIRESEVGTRIEAAFDPVLGRGVRLRAELLVERPKETLNVVVPLGDEHFQFTSKQAALAATGEVRVDDRVYLFDPELEAFACLDYGRGVWPYRTTWNWGSCAGRVSGRVVGLNLGGRWTDGTGATENGFVVDGVLHKIHEPVHFSYDPHHLEKPWRVRSARVDLTFTPRYSRVAQGNVGLLGARLRWCLGSWTGTLVDDRGSQLQLRSLLGFAEEVRARW